MDFEKDKSNPAVWSCYQALAGNPKRLTWSAIALVAVALIGYAVQKALEGALPWTVAVLASALLGISLHGYHRLRLGLESERDTAVTAKADAEKRLSDALTALQTAQGERADREASKDASPEEQAKALRACFAYLCYRGAALSQRTPYEPEIGTVWGRTVSSLASRSLYGEVCNNILWQASNTKPGHDHAAASAAASNIAHMAKEIALDHMLHGFNAIAEHRRLTTEVSV